MNPQQHVCPDLSTCKLNTKQKCKACWIYACMNCYTVDNHRRLILERFRPTTGRDGDEPMVRPIDQKCGQVNDERNNEERPQQLNELLNVQSPSVEDDELMDEEQADEMDDDSSPPRDEELPLDYTINGKKPSANDQPDGARESAENLNDTAQKLPNSVDLLNSIRPQSTNSVTNQATNQVTNQATNQATNQTNQPLKAEPNASKSKPTGFQLMQTNQTDELIDWNNNSLPNMLNGDQTSDQSNILKHLNNHQNLNSLSSLNNLNALSGFGKQMPTFSVLNDFSDATDGPLNKKTKNWSCLKCENCKAPDCGKCGF